MNTTSVTIPNELEIRVERVFDAPRAHVYSVWTDPELIPEWWGDGTVVEEIDVRPGGTYRFRTEFGVVEGEFREVDAPERLVQTFQNHLQTLAFEDLGERTKLTQTMRFATTEERHTTMQYGVEEAPPPDEGVTLLVHPDGDEIAICEARPDLGYLRRGFVRGLVVTGDRVTH